MSPVTTDRRHVEPVPFFTQARSFEESWPLIREQLDDLVEHGKYSHGATVAKFEAELAAWTGARCVVAVNSGTDALVIVLRACGLRPGDEVIVPAVSFMASASTVVLAGLAPWWFGPAMLPVIVLRGGQLWIGVRRGDILRAFP